MGRRLNPLDPNRANVRKKSALLTLAKSPKKINTRRITERKKKILREKKSVHTKKKKTKFLRPTSIFLCTKLRSCFLKMTTHKDKHRSATLCLTGALKKAFFPSPSKNKDLGRKISAKSFV